MEQLPKKHKKGRPDSGSPWKLAKVINMFTIILVISVRPEEVWPNLSSIQGIII